MNLTEQHVIKVSDPRFAELDYLCFLSKNLYNAALYQIRQQYFKDGSYTNFFALDRLFKETNQPDYRALETKVSQQTLRLLDRNFKSFFKLLKLKATGKIDFIPKIPKYLDKVKGRQVLTFTKLNVSKPNIRKGVLKLSGVNSTFITKHTAVQSVRFVHKGNHIVVEVIYKCEEKELAEDNGRYCSIDLGVNNLATIGSNILKPVIINGKPLKAVNQFYNKRLASLKSHMERTHGKKSSKRIKSLTFKRNNKVKDYLHKSSRYIINHLVSNQINTLVIGLNKGWKQEINIGKKNNQKFVQIPHSRFIEMLVYKAKLEGIRVIVTEEAYTSKCSFMDNEDIKRQEVYKGRRVKRGLFKSPKGVINADLNGALNILRKVIGEFQYPIEVCSTPKILNLEGFHIK